MQFEITVQAWQPSHPRWEELLQVVEGEGQTAWLQAQYEWHQSSHVLVALSDGEIRGFLRMVTQVIGVDSDCDPVMLRGEPLIEAKVLAFAVVESFRRQGVGRKLQKEAIQTAAQLGCYQLRSHSSGDNRANHQLKLSMGFAVHPILRDDDTGGAYYIMPLKREN